MASRDTQKALARNLDCLDNILIKLGAKMPVETAEAVVWQAEGAYMWLINNRNDVWTLLYIDETLNFYYKTRANGSEKWQTYKLL